MIALGVAIPVLVVGYFLATGVLSTRFPPRTYRADTGYPAPATTALAGGEASGASSVGGWGRGGYPMVTGPANGTGWNAFNGDGQRRGRRHGERGGPDQRELGRYAATGTAGSLTSVSSSWAQPAVTCGATDTFSSTWVGLDGDGTPTVEQTGTEADCAGGVASYQGWYEIFPNAPVFFANPVQPGDAMSASVMSAGDGTFTLTLTDGTQGWTQTTKQAEPGAQLGSAEVIAEAPSNGAVLPLADFGTVNFANATVDDAPIGDSANLSELTMESGSGVALATPSTLTAGNAFSSLSDSGSTVTTAPGGGGGGGGTVTTAPGGGGGGGGPSGTTTTAGASKRCRVSWDSFGRYFCTTPRRA